MTRAGVVTSSDSVAAGRATDRSGPMAVTALLSRGFAVKAALVVPDDVAAIQAAIRELVADGCRLVVVTGGTGIGPRDVTPEAISELTQRAVPGVGEILRASERARLPAVDLSRSGAWVLSGVLVVALPGSPAAVHEGLATVSPLLDHALAMLDGEGHQRHDHAPAIGHDESHDDHPPRPLISPAPIDPGAISAGICSAAEGALVTFEGRVRDHDHGRVVASLRYEAHPDAHVVLADIVAQARAVPEVGDAMAVHRVGELEIGDLAFFVAASAAHRRAAFDTCAWLVDEVKRRLPVWKLQRYADGEQEWVNCA